MHRVSPPTNKHGRRSSFGLTSIANSYVSGDVVGTLDDAFADDSILPPGYVLPTSKSPIRHGNIRNSIESNKERTCIKSGRKMHDEKESDKTVTQSEETVSLRDRIKKSRLESKKNITNNKMESKNLYDGDAENHLNLSNKYNNTEKNTNGGKKHDIRKNKAKHCVTNTYEDNGKTHDKKQMENNELLSPTRSINKETQSKKNRKKKNKQFSPSIEERTSLNEYTIKEAYSNIPHKQIQENIDTYRSCEKYSPTRDIDNNQNASNNKNIPYNENHKTNLGRNFQLTKKNRRTHSKDINHRDMQTTTQHTDNVYQIDRHNQSKHTKHRIEHNHQNTHQQHSRQNPDANNFFNTRTKVDTSLHRILQSGGFVPDDRLVIRSSEIRESLAGRTNRLKKGVRCVPLFRDPQQLGGYTGLLIIEPGMSYGPVQQSQSIMSLQLESCEEGTVMWIKPNGLEVVMNISNICFLAHRLVYGFINRSATKECILRIVVAEIGVEGFNPSECLERLSNEQEIMYKKYCADEYMACYPDDDQNDDNDNDDNDKNYENNNEDINQNDDTLLAIEDQEGQYPHRKYDSNEERHEKLRKDYKIKRRKKKIYNDTPNNIYADKLCGENYANLKYGQNMPTHHNHMQY